MSTNCDKSRCAHLKLSVQFKQIQLWQPLSICIHNSTRSADETNEFLRVGACERDYSPASADVV
jgi:hypothetical protein